MTDIIRRSAEEYDEFHVLAHKLSARRLTDDAYLIGASSQSEVIDLALMGITHGDEVAGLALMNELLRKLGSGAELRISLALILGNYQATMKGKRFIERDLNRCFDLRDDSTSEGKRARQIAPLLQRCRYLIDFHQTAVRSECSFSIFPFSGANLSWALAVHGGSPIVTRFGDGFSAAGMCTDEYVLQHEGVGITIELGQKGYEQRQVNHALALALRAITQVERGGIDKLNMSGLTDKAKKAAAVTAADRAKTDLYTVAQTVNYPDDGVFQLASGLYNFKSLSQGEVLATFSDRQVVCSVAGYALFPKYQVNRNSPPSEICHVLKKVRY